MPRNANVIDRRFGLHIGRKTTFVSARRPARVALQGRWVQIVPLDPAAHAEALYEGTHGADRDQRWLYLSEGPFAEPAAFRAYLEKLSRSEDPLSFAIVQNTTGKALGHASYMRVVVEHGVIEVGNIFYSSALAGTTGGTEAMFLMARHVFEDLGYRRYEWKCNSLNEPSRRAALRYGFSLEGVFRQHMVQKGRNRDTAWYAMLDHEWPARKAKFENWLSLENFDETGKQRTRLSNMR